MEKHVYAVFTNAVEGRDEECANWYVDAHVSDMVERYGFSSGQHFRFDMAQYFPDFPFRYLTLYDVPEGEFKRLHADHAKAMTAHVDRLQNDSEGTTTSTMPLSPALDLEGARSFWLTALHEPVRRKEAK
ncbi:hypothetical protein [Sphingobium tyrosinilyticum]|uniref:Uncharacterized protein n=1 Tax=Sphingobium tyrosinilyticum TaxID=2715436 RepID=A0ABV9F3E8_9SPHN